MCSVIHNELDERAAVEEKYSRIIVAGQSVSFEMKLVKSESKLSWHSIARYSIAR